MYDTLISVPGARPAHRIQRRAFTLVELLVVIGIIAILIAILIPVIGAVRRAAYKTNTANEINVIAAAIESYYGDFKAYPGPIAEANLIGATGATGAVCTSSQNLVWGLEGGWEPTYGSSDPVNNGYFSSAMVGQGAMSFNLAATASTANPTSLSGTSRSRPYLDATFLMPQPWCSSSKADPYAVTGSPPDGSPAATGLYAPVYVDRYPIQKTVASPILYMRAHLGVVGGTTPSFQICTYGTSSTSGAPATYDNAQLVPYATYFPELGKVTPPVNTSTHKQDYATWTAYFADPNTINLVNGSVQTISGIQPIARHANSFLLISPGYDGQFGTADDITN